MPELSITSPRNKYDTATPFNRSAMATKDNFGNMTSGERMLETIQQRQHDPTFGAHSKSVSDQSSVAPTQTVHAGSKAQLHSKKRLNEVSLSRATITGHVKAALARLGFNFLEQEP